VLLLNHSFLVIIFFSHQTNSETSIHPMTFPQRAVALVCLHLLAFCAFAQSSAKDIVRAALSAQGGEQKLRTLKNVSFDALGYRNMVEQSERPEGPYVTEFDHISEIHDQAQHRFYRKLVGEVPPFPGPTDILVLSNGIPMRVLGPNRIAGSSSHAAEADELLALSPEHLLLTALDASDLTSKDDTQLQSVPQHVVTFHYHGSPVLIFLNADTMLPTAVESSGAAAHNGFWNYLGDVTMRTYYDFWWLAKGGVHFPLQWNLERNGLPDRMLMISSLKVDGNLDESTFSVPEAVRAQVSANANSSDLEQVPLGLPNQPATEIVPGVVFIPGRWNVTLIKQADGVVILEAPISSGYSAKVIEEAKRRFPGVPIKAVITTSDAWPHLAGIREYVAARVPIYAVDRNEPILRRVIDSSRTTKPDTLSRNSGTPAFRLVSGKTVLGTGANRLELYPLRGETSERQMMVYFPEHRLLYGSDAFQKDQTTYYIPQTVGELIDAVKREHLSVDRFFMMHVEPTAWGDLGQVLEKAAAEDSPKAQ
jgi:hypothetical protein